jgi:hypothetical protein
LIVGIDFSINSTAVTVRDGDNYVMMSFVPNYRPELKSSSTHEFLSNLITIRSYNKLGASKNSIEDQRNKICNADSLSSEIMKELNPILKKIERVNIEGFSYASKGNSFIDLITFNSFLKSKLFTAIGNRIYVIPPKTLKKDYTGNGNASKCDMLLSYMEKNDNQLTDKIKKLGFIKEDDFQIPKPIDDLIDSIALSEYVAD